MRTVATTIRQLWMLALVVLAAAAWFLVESNGAVAETSRSVLHGLCAQRPTHSFTVGGELLPFDARMTGIYSGALASWIVLLIGGRLLTSATPSKPVVTILVGAVLLLAIDGFNALLVDLDTWHPYEPLNVLRFFTGFGTGVALTSLQSWLIGASLWRLGKELPVWRSPASLSWVVPVSAMVYAMVQLAPAWSYSIVALTLLASAWITVTGLVLVILVSLLRIEAGVTSLSRLNLPLTGSAVLALGVILALAQGRFWLERTLGIPQDFIAAGSRTLAAILSV